MDGFCIMFRKFSLKKLIHGSILYRIVLYITLLCISICLLFSMVIASANTQNMKERQNDSYRSIVNHIAGEAEFIIQSLNESITQLSYQQSLATVMYTNDPSRNALNSVIVDLSITMEHLPLVEKIAMYLPSQNVVIASDFTRLPLDTSPDSGVIDHFLHSGQSFASIETANKTGSLVYYGNSLYLMRKVPLSGPSYLGILFYRINTEQLYKQLTSNLESGTSLYFSAEDDSGQRFVWPQEPSETANTVISTSDLLKTDFIMIIPEDPSHITMLKAIHSSLPAILLITVAVIFVSVYISIRFYSPVQKLYTSAQQLQKEIAEQSDETAAADEINYIHNSISSVLDHRNHLSDLLKSASREATDRFFRDYLTGTDYSSAMIREIIKVNPYEFEYSSYYIIYVFELADGTPFDEDRIVGIKRFMRDLCGAQSPLHMSTHSLVLDGRAVSIICLDKDLPASDVGKALSVFESSVYKELPRLEDSVLLGCGKLYHSIMDVPYSYNAALNALHAGPDRKQEEPETNTENKSQTETPSERAVQLTRKALSSSDSEETSDFLRRIVWDFENHSASQMHLYSKYCRPFIISLRENISQIPYVNPKYSPSQLLNMDDVKISSMTTHDISEITIEDCNQILKELEEALSLQKNKHIVTAREYIDSHYTDPALSLAEIAEAQDISQNYLSKLFVNSMGVRITEYINRKRVDKSVELLKNSDMQIQQIAAECGFNSAQNFIRVFTKAEGSSPRKFRETAKKTNEA